jgi:hypothetical protein
MTTLESNKSSLRNMLCIPVIATATQIVQKINTFMVMFSSINFHFNCCEFESRSLRGVIDTTLRDKDCQWLATGLWFSPGTPVYSTNKTDCHDITVVLLKAALNTITHTPFHFIRFIFRYVKSVVSLSNIVII